jgi:endonuclease/exonuclease/phosphatase family metal-dependent hydrolase
LKLRILSWNLWHGLDPYKPMRMSPMQSPREHADRYQGQLDVLSAWRRSPSEVMCFQEVNPVAKRFAQLSAALGRKGGTSLVNAGIKVGGFGVPWGLQEGLGILVGDGVRAPVFSEITLSGTGKEIRSSGGTPLITFQTAERRKALLMEGELEGLKIAVVDLHLHHGPDTGAENLRRKRQELERLGEWIGPRLDGWDLVAVCGDFNCGRDSACLEPLKALGFTDAAELAGVTQAPTWDPKDNRFAADSARMADREETRAWDGAAHVFDRIYLRPRPGSARPVQVSALQLLREPELSDHFGVWAELTL